jgi:uncharacterized protein (TIGR02996 family)
MPTRPKSPFPRPAAVLPGEADILAKVLDNLADHDAKLVYADWLEERDDHRGPLLRKFVQAYRAGARLSALKGTSPAWRELVGLTLIAQFRGAGLGAQADEFFSLARPALAVASEAAPEAGLAVGAGKYGGRPDLPAGAKWPKFEGEPLAFLGQLNLAALRPSPAARELPGAGVLSMFAAYDRESGNDDFPKGSWRLFHFPGAAKLVRHEPDAGLPEESCFPSCRLWFTEWLTLPHEDSQGVKRLLDDSEVAEAYADLYVDRALGDHVLGHPVPIQRGEPGKKGARHLLTIGGNDDTEWEWGDGGALYFTLPEADLKAGRFDRAAMEMQCG